MPHYDHLELRRLEGALDRRKKPGFGATPPRNAPAHGHSLQTKVEELVETRKRKPKIAGIDPALILRIRTTGSIDEDTWARLGLSVLANDADKSLILFATDTELQEFRTRIIAYQADPPDGQKSHSYSSIFSNIEEISDVAAADRIGPVLRTEGLDHPDSFNGHPEDIFDIELWHPGEDNVLLFTNRVATKTTELGGEVISEYYGQGVALIRLRCTGEAIKQLLELPEIAAIDRPPVPDLPTMADSEFAGAEFAIGAPPAEGAITIGIIDSGVSDGHPLLAPAVAGAFGVPTDLGAADERGHGTPVSGIAVYGDVRAHIGLGRFDARFRIASARVVNNRGRFDDKQLVPQQIELAIRRLHEDYDCRVINISLADDARQAGDKPSAWASVLDELARDLDLVIVVSAGNSRPQNLIGKYGDRLPDAYPEFLRDESNRLLEPGTAINVVTVGSLSHSNGLAQEDGDLVGVRPITKAGEPSPFTRIGPGIGGMIKPDFVDYGGTAILYGESLADGSSKPAAGIVSLNNHYTARYFTSGSGTSFAAPLVAYKAAMLREKFTDASANLIRALMALSAEWPAAAEERLASFPPEDIINVCGYGMIDVERAMSSDDARVVLYREDSLAIDKFAVYEVPIPPVFQTEKGERHVKVALAFDPPVRHTRLDYAGLSMGMSLIRGASEDEVFDHFRRWEKAEGSPFKLATKMKCSLWPNQTLRERGALQCGTFVAKRDISSYGDRYFLVVRCEGGWAHSLIDEQEFAVAVELSHQASIPLYERVRERVRIRT